MVSLFKAARLAAREADTLVSIENTFKRQLIEVFW